MSQSNYSRLENENTPNEDETLHASSSNENNGEDDTKKEPSISYFSLYRYASRRDKFYIFLAIVTSMLCGCSTPFDTIIFANLLQSMVDYGASVANNDPHDEAFLKAILTFAILSCIIGLSILVLTYISTVAMNTAAYNQVYKIRQEYLKAALSQDFEYYDKNQTGDIATKLNESVTKVEDGIGEKLTIFIFYQTSFVSTVIMALIKGWKLALLCLISFPVTMILFGVAEMVSARLSNKETIVSGKAGSVAEEVISSIRTVYAFNGQEKELARYQEHLTEARNINIKKGFINGISSGVLYFCIFGSYALSFWFGYKLMIDEPDHYDVATMIAVFFGVMVASSNFGISTMFMDVFGVASGAGAQIFNLIDNIPKINPLLERGVTPDLIEANIELKNVVFYYPSRPDVPVLSGVNLSVKRGQSVALVGPSGCGKSTVINLISRYYDVVDGSVSVDEHDVRDLSVRWLRAQIGLVGQEPVLFNSTVRENIRYGREGSSDSDVEAAARQANAHNFICKLPKGYDTLVGERGTSLSGGQKQRIAIARALIRNPHILLLDEATSALDYSSEAKVQRALDKARQGRTTIVVAHRLSTVRNVDVIYVFQNGTIVESGNHKELMEKNGHYHDMVMLQKLPGSSEDNEDFEPKTSTIIEEEDDEEEIMESRVETNDDEEEIKKVSFWRVIRLNASEWPSITVASLCSLLSGFAWPILGIVLGDFVGVLSKKGDVQKEVNFYALVFVGTGVILAIANFIMVFLYAIAGEFLTERLRRLMFINLLQQEVGFYDDKNNSTGAISARLSGEAAAVQGATGQRISTVVQAFGSFTFALVMSIIYQWQVGLVSLSLVPLTALILYTQGRMITADSSETAKTMESSSKIASEAVANVRTVASLGREEQFLVEYSVELIPALYIAKRATHWRGFIYGLSRGLYSFVYAIAMYYGGTLIVYSRVDYSRVLISAQALIMGSSSAAEVFAWAPNFQKGIEAAGRIIVLLNRKSKITDPVQPAVVDFDGTGEAHLQAVHFRYPTRSSIAVLENFSLNIDQAKTIALVGASGCGKSTVIQLLERYYDPNRGVVTKDEFPLQSLRLEDARRGIGFVQQEPVLFDRTISENIAYGDNSRKPGTDEIIKAAKEANIHQFIVSLPAGYNSNIGSKGTQLSGGQKQRIAIARALIRRPNMLLLDEATSALDTESEKVVQEALDRAKAGRTCVMIAHRLSTIRDADAIYVIKDGRIAESGTHTELMALKTLYYELNVRAHS